MGNIEYNPQSPSGSMASQNFDDVNITGGIIAADSFTLAGDNDATVVSQVLHLAPGNNHLTLGGPLTITDAGAELEHGQWGFLHVDTVDGALTIAPGSENNLWCEPVVIAQANVVHFLFCAHGGGVAMVLMGPPHEY